jgi:hypothetical protein
VQLTSRFFLLGESLLCGWLVLQKAWLENAAHADAFSRFGKHASVAARPVDWCRQRLVQ